MTLMTTTVNHASQNQQPSPDSQYQIRHLLYFFELVNQALEIKLESLYLFPSFLHAAVSQVKSRNGIEQLTKLGTNVLHHVQTLRKVITDLGGTVDQDLFPTSQQDPEELLSTLSFQEELASQIVETCQDVVDHHWQDSHLKSWVLQELAAIQHDTHLHGVVFEQLFSRTQPRYRDHVLERFRVTALP